MSSGRLHAELLREERSADRLLQSLRVPRELDCWPGHFPGAELVPGVVQLGWVARALRAWLGGPTRWTEIAALKFKALLLPGQELSLELVRDGDGRQVRFALFAGEVIYACGRLVLGEGGS